MAKDETVLDSLSGLPQPRKQHYEFVHGILPDAIRSDPEGFLSAVSGQEGKDLVDELWKTCKERFPSTNDKVDPTGLDVTTRELECGHRCILTVMPRAERMGEAHFAAAVIVPGGKMLGLFRKAASVRFFTLEVSFEGRAKETTAFFEWQFNSGGGRSHLGLGSGIAADQEEFLKAVNGRL
jgi:hypothetical protein